MSETIIIGDRTIKYDPSSNTYYDAVTFELYTPNAPKKKSAPEKPVEQLGPPPKS